MNTLNLIEVRLPTALKSADLVVPAELLNSAANFVKDAKEQLASTPHYGVLAQVIERNEEVTSRLEYVYKQCVLLHRLKTQAPGVGLGSNGNFPGKRPDGQNPWGKLQGLSGLDICQSWTVLLNAGHLFGTFATERPLLFEVDRALTFRELFVRSIAGMDVEAGGPFRPHIQATLDRSRLHSFHYLLALWRVRDGGTSSLAHTLLHQARLLIRAFLLPPSSKIERLKSIFQRIRMLTYLELHSGLQSTRHHVREVTDADLRLLFPVDALPEADWIASAQWDVYHAMDRADAHRIFASSQASAEVLAHVEQFARWWSGSTLAVEQRLDALFEEPEDWPASTKKVFKHFIQLRVPSSSNWLHEVRHWLRDDHERDPWHGSNFLITPGIADDSLQIDLYSGDDGIDANTLEHVVAQLSRPFLGQSGIKDEEGLGMSTARLLARAFEALLKPNHHLRLTPIQSQGERTGYAVAGSTYEFVRGRVKQFLSIASDEQRSKELRQLLAVADKVVGWRTVAFAMVATAELVREEKTRNNVVTDIDGLIGFFKGGMLYWLIVETKIAASGDGEEQLRDGVLAALSIAAPQIQYQRFGTEDTWSVIVEAPQRFSIPAEEAEIARPDNPVGGAVNEIGFSKSDAPE